VKYSMGCGCTKIECPICHSTNITRYFNDRVGDIMVCMECGFTWDTRHYPEEIKIPVARVVGSVIGAGLASILTAMVTESFPKKTDPPEVKSKKFALLTAGFLSSGFIGLLIGLITS